MGRKRRAGRHSIERVKTTSRKCRTKSISLLSLSLSLSLEQTRANTLSLSSLIITTKRAGVLIYLLLTNNSDVIRVITCVFFSCHFPNPSFLHQLKPWCPEKVVSSGCGTRGVRREPRAERQERKRKRKRSEGGGDGDGGGGGGVWGGGWC